MILDPYVELLNNPNTIYTESQKLDTLCSESQYQLLKNLELEIPNCKK